MTKKITWKSVGRRNIWSLRVLHHECFILSAANTRSIIWLQWKVLWLTVLYILTIKHEAINTKRKKLNTHLEHLREETRANFLACEVIKTSKSGKGTYQGSVWRGTNSSYLGCSPFTSATIEVFSALQAWWKSCYWIPLTSVHSGNKILFRYGRTSHILGNLLSSLLLLDPKIQEIEITITVSVSNKVDRTPTKLTPV